MTQINIPSALQRAIRENHERLTTALDALKQAEQERAELITIVQRLFGPGQLDEVTGVFAVSEEPKEAAPEVE